MDANDMPSRMIINPASLKGFPSLCNCPGLRANISPAISTSIPIITSAIKMNLKIIKTVYMK
jgi:hypothetical protein